MRRVIDDTHFDEVANTIVKLIRSIPVAMVIEWSYGTYRVKVYLVRKYIEDHYPAIKFGHNEHANGIYNNNAIECIWKSGTSDTDEQICALLHLTIDMFGGIYAWVSDVDDGRNTTTYFITDRGVRIK